MTAIETLTRELDRMDGTYANLLGLLARIKSGEVDPALIEVDLLARSWRLTEALPPPEIVVIPPRIDFADLQKPAAVNGHDGEPADA